MAYIRKIKPLRYLPFSPTYNQFVAGDNFVDDEKRIIVNENQAPAATGNDLVDSKL